MQEIKRKRGLSKLVNTKVTTARRQRRLRAIKIYKEEDSFGFSFAFLRPVNIMSGDVVNKSQRNDRGL